MPRSLALPALQRWFQGAVLGAFALPRRARPRAAGVVKPSRTLSADERVAIYARSVFSRFHDCLAEDFPTVRRLVGDDAFRRLARAYLTKHPSRSPSLNHLGRALPRFLGGPVRVPRRALLADVATIEDAVSQVFDEAEVPPLSAADFAAVPEGAWRSAGLAFVPAFRLLALAHPANRLVTAVARDRPLPRVRRAPSFVAVYRKAYRVWRAELSAAQHALLRALQRGATLLDAIAAAARAADEPLEGRIGDWFREWVAEGLFARVTRVRAG